MEKDQLPQPIAEAVAARYPDEPIRLAISSDIAQHGQYGTEWLVATGGHLLVFPGDAATATHDITLADLEELKAEDTVGGGCRHRAHRIGGFAAAPKSRALKARRRNH